jgi:uncharacterized membrane protein
MKALEILKQVSANKLPTFDTTQEFVTYANKVITLIPSSIGYNITVIDQDDVYVKYYTI